MSVERQDMDAADAAWQARLDHLFRKQLRDDPADSATAALRRCMEAYRLPQVSRAQDQDQAGTAS